MLLLVVDDNARMRASIKRYLSERISDQHTIREAADGAEAIAMYERLRPDWVLMDVAMEPIDGLTASRTILRSHADARIIILTNYDDPGYRKAARKAGTKAFVLKDNLSDVASMLLP